MFAIQTQCFYLQLNLDFIGILFCRINRIFTDEAVVNYINYNNEELMLLT